MAKKSCRSSVQMPYLTSELRKGKPNIVYRIRSKRDGRFSLADRLTFSKWGKVWMTIGSVWKALKKQEWGEKTHVMNESALDSLEVIEYEMVERRIVEARDLLSGKCDLKPRGSEINGLELKAGDIVLFDGVQKMIDKIVLDGVRFTDGSWGAIDKCRITPNKARRHKSLIDKLESEKIA